MVSIIIDLDLILHFDTDSWWRMTQHLIDRIFCTLRESGTNRSRYNSFLSPYFRSTCRGIGRRVLAFLVLFSGLVQGA